MVIAAVVINIGMWLERFIVVVPTMALPRLLSDLATGKYSPTWVEAAITAACFAGLVFLYALFTRFFPIIPIWERSEEVEAYLHEEEV
jgi:molybdopterin-containing oxidoreductase family membrane subunit